MVAALQLAPVIVAAWFYLPSKFENLRWNRCGRAGPTECLDRGRGEAREWIKILTCDGRVCVVVDTDQGQSHLD
jgi:hypothetical protein